jgi:hypothetical protein
VLGLGCRLQLLQRHSSTTRMETTRRHPDLKD